MIQFNWLLGKKYKKLAICFLNIFSFQQLLKNININWNYVEHTWCCSSHQDYLSLWYTVYIGHQPAFWHILAVNMSNCPDFDLATQDNIVLFPFPLPKEGAATAWAYAIINLFRSVSFLRSCFLFNLSVHL